MRLYRVKAVSYSDRTLMCHEIEVVKETAKQVRVERQYATDFSLRIYKDEIDTCTYFSSKEKACVAWLTRAQEVYDGVHKVLLEAQELYGKI